MDKRILKGMIAAMAARSPSKSLAAEVIQQMGRDRAARVRLIRSEIEGSAIEEMMGEVRSKLEEHSTVLKTMNQNIINNTTSHLTTNTGMMVQLKHHSTMLETLSQKKEPKKLMQMSIGDYLNYLHGTSFVKAVALLVMTGAVLDGYARAKEQHQGRVGEFIEGLDLKNKWSGFLEGLNKQRALLLGEGKKEVPHEKGQLKKA